MSDRSDKLFQAFTGLDQDLLERAERRPARRAPLLWVGAAAACLALCLFLPHFTPARPGDIQNDPPLDTENPGKPDGSEEPDDPGETDNRPPQEQGEGPADPGPSEEPPYLVYNDAQGAEPANTPEPVRTPMSAWQLELCWSSDCPTAFLEPGEEDRWYYDSNLSGEVWYREDGTVRCLCLTYRSLEWDVPVTVTLSPTSSPEPSGCVLHPNTQPEISPVGSLSCAAYRWECGGDVALLVEFTAGDVLYQVKARTEPDREWQAAEVVLTAVTSLQDVVGRTPDLSAFVMGDPTSGRLTGENSVRLLTLADNREGTDALVIFRDGRVFLQRPGEARLTVFRGTLSHESLLRLRELLSSAPQGEEGELALTAYDPWNQQLWTSGGSSASGGIAEILSLLREDQIPLPDYDL